MPAMSIGRIRAACTECQGQLYIMGGNDGFSALSDLTCRARWSYPTCIPPYRIWAIVGPLLFPSLLEIGASKLLRRSRMLLASPEKDIVMLRCS